MEPKSTGDVVRALMAEGFTVTRKRLDGLIATGRIHGPRMVGPVRVWMPDNVDCVRDVLLRLDGEPQQGAENAAGNGDSTRPKETS